MTTRDQRVWAAYDEAMRRYEALPGDTSTLGRLAAIYTEGNVILRAGTPRNWRERLLARFGR